MKIGIVKSKEVLKDNDVFLLHIGYGPYDLGIQIHKWGFRLMFIWWHVCFLIKINKE